MERLVHSNAWSDASGSERLRVLEKEVAKAKESERKMLESLVHQTRLLEQAKISLEEAKLEVASLQQSTKKRGSAETRRGNEEEVRALRSELRAAVQAEERSRRALDDLAAALSDVAAEAKQVKGWLSEAQAELERANAEVRRLEVELESAASELRYVTERHKWLKAEAEASAAAWGEKEKLLLGRVQASEDAASRAEHENSMLKDTVAEKESVLQSLRQEYERLKAGDATAPASVKELSGLLAVAAMATNGAREKGRAQDDLSPLVAEPGKFGVPDFSDYRRTASRKDRMFASLSNIAELKSAAAAAAAMDDFDYEFDHVDGGHFDGTDHAAKQKKKRRILRKFADLFRRRRFL